MVAEALLGVLGNALGGFFGFLGADRQARAVEEVAQSRERSIKNLVDAAIVQWHELGRIVEAQMGTAREAVYWGQSTQRSRIYYNYKALQASQGLLLLGAGAGLVGLAVWLGSREKEGVKA